MEDFSGFRVFSIVDDCTQAEKKDSWRYAKKGMIATVLYGSWALRKG